MINRYVIGCILVVFSVFTKECFSNNDSLSKYYGAYGGLNINMHSANFRNLPGIPNCCPRFEEGSGIGFNFGILYEQNIANRIRIGARLGIQTLDGTLKKDEPTFLNTPDGSTTGIFEHKVVSKFMNIGFEPMIIFNFFKDMHFSIGGRLGQNLTKDFSQVETITKPDGVGTFLDDNGNDSGKRTRNEFSGELNDAIGFQLGLVSGLSYELPMNFDNTLRLVPEIFYYHSFSELVRNTDWNVNSLRGSIAIKYTPAQEKEVQEIYRKEYKIDTLKIESVLYSSLNYKLGKETVNSFTDNLGNEIIKTDIISRVDTIFSPKIYKLEGDILAVGVDFEGKEIQNPVFRIEEFISNRLDPLLNYIFFDDNASSLPLRYVQLSKEQSKNFKITDLFRDSTTKIYLNILNILGDRLSENPKSKITLTGCNSDNSLETNNLELSKKRAETIKDYLTNVWGIDGNRIKIEARNLPVKASTPKNEPDKIAENRRVEIYSDDSKILESVFIEKIDRNANPPVVRFKFSVDAEAGIKKLTITAKQNSNQLNNFNVEFDTNLNNQVDWVLANDQINIPHNPEPLNYSLKVEDKKSKEKSTETKTLPVEIITIQKKQQEMLGDYQIEKFSLILFDFDKSTIDESNKKIIDIIKSRISPNSEIEITGFTDRTGNPEYNQKLSEQRANSVKAAISRNDAKAKGVGQNELLYNNDTPEGRFYCRTVNIIVKTKVK